MDAPDLDLAPGEPELGIPVLLTAAQTAAACGVSVTTIRRLGRRSGTFPRPIYIATRQMWRRPEIAGWLAAGGERGAA